MQVRPAPTLGFPLETPTGCKVFAGLNRTFAGSLSEVTVCDGSAAGGHPTVDQRMINFCLRRCLISGAEGFSKGGCLPICLVGLTGYDEAAIVASKQFSAHLGELL